MSALDPYKSLKLKDVKAGERFYECEAGSNAELIALEDARQVDEDRGGIPYRGYACKVKSADGTTELFEAHDAGGYGLRLYRAPVYSTPVRPVAAPTWVCERGCGYDGNAFDRIACEVCGRGKGD